MLKDDLDILLNSLADSRDLLKIAHAVWDSVAVQVLQSLADNDDQTAIRTLRVALEDVMRDEANGIIDAKADLEAQIRRHLQ